MTNYPINLTVPRVLELPDDQFYAVVDSYLKGRMDRYLVSLDHRELMETYQAARDKDNLDPECERVFASVRRDIHDILYSEEVVARFWATLRQMARHVETQITSNELGLQGKIDSGRDEPEDHEQHRRWKKSATWFLRLVKDEIDRVTIVADAVKASSDIYLRNLLEIIEEHKTADDDMIDNIEQRLYATADDIRASL